MIAETRAPARTCTWLSGLRDRRVAAYASGARARPPRAPGTPAHGRRRSNQGPRTAFCWEHLRGSAPRPTVWKTVVRLSTPQVRIAVVGCRGELEGRARLALLARHR